MPLLFGALLPDAVGEARGDSLEGDDDAVDGEKKDAGDCALATGLARADEGAEEEELELTGLSSNAAEGNRNEFGEGGLVASGASAPSV